MSHRRHFADHDGNDQGDTSMGNVSAPPVLIDVRSPEVGVFHPDPELWALAARQTVPVSIGQVVGYIEALGLRHNVLSPAEGWLARAETEPDRPVEYGQVLYRLILLSGLSIGNTVLSRSAEPRPDTTTEASANRFVIRAPIIGVFYAAPGPDAEPYVQINQDVAPDQPVCIIEAMKLFNEIKADVGGRVVEILVANGATVEKDQALFVLAIDGESLPEVHP